MTGPMTVVKRDVKEAFDIRSLYSRVLPIIKLLAAGNYPSKIARALGFSRQLVGYYVRRMEELDLVKRKAPRWPATYEVTETCQKLLDGIEGGVAPGRILRLHNCVFKFPVMREPRISIDWGRVQLRNWGQLIGRELGLTVRKNPESLEIFCDVLEGGDPYELLFLAFEEACRLARVLEAKFQMSLGRPSLSRKPHFGVYDPVAALLGRYYQWSGDSAKIDESEGLGELDILDPNLAAEYLLMPRYLRELLGIQREFGEGMREHMRLIRALQTVAERLEAAADAVLKAARKGSYARNEAKKYSLPETARKGSYTRKSPKGRKLVTKSDLGRKMGRSRRRF